MATGIWSKTRLRSRERSPDISAGPKPAHKGPSPKTASRNRKDSTIEGLLSSTPVDSYHHLSNISPTFTNDELRFFSPTKTSYLLHDAEDSEQLSSPYEFEDVGFVQVPSDVGRFANNNFLESVLMDPLGTFVPDAFLYSNEPQSDVLNTPPHRSPSPILTPVMSPETPPVFVQPSTVIQTLSEEAKVLNRPSLRETSKSPSKQQSRTGARKSRLLEESASTNSTALVPVVDQMRNNTNLSKSKLDNEQQLPMKQRISEYIKRQAEEPCERPGKIISLEMRNVLCHEEFRQVWNPHVNYITGRNGSGKSAILTAIQLGLGSKAILTGKGTSAKELIRTGKASARIEITLTNDGILDIEKYGPKIGIIRVVRWDGSSRYHVRTADSQVRALPIKELELICATLQIMPSNPVMFLNQENSKNFMKKNDGKGLYTYFYRGMLLEQCENLHMKAQADIDSAKAALVTKTKMLDDLLVTVSELRKEYERIKDLEKGTLRLKELDNEFNWANVREAENDVAFTTKDYNALEKQCSENEIELESVTTKINTLESNLKSYTNMIKNLSDALGDQRDKFKQKQKEAKTWGQDLRTLRLNRDAVSKAIVKYKAEVTSIETNMAQMKKQIETDYEIKAKKLAEDRQSYEDQINSVKEKQVQEIARKDEADAELEKCKTYEADCEAKYREPEGQLRERREELKQIEKNKNAKYSRFGPEMVRLMSEIDDHVQRKVFKDPPLGPQSACFTVKEEYNEFAALIEYIMGASLLQFCVCHYEDMQLLKKLIYKIYKNKPKPDIHFQKRRTNKKYPLIDIKRNSGFNTVLSAIDIIDDDPLITNWLVDSRRIEAIILFKTSKEADDAMKEQSLVPKGCEWAYTLDGNKVQPAPKYRFYTIATKVKKKPYYVQVSSSLKNDELVRVEIGELEVECVQLQKELQLAKEKTKRAQLSCTAAKKQLQLLQNEMKKLKTALGNLEVLNSQAPDLASYADGLEDLNSRIKLKTDELGNTEQKIKELEPTYEDACLTLKESEKGVAEIQSKIDELNTQKESKTEYYELGLKSKYLGNSLAKLTLQKDKAEKQMKEARASLAKFMKEADATGERVHTIREPSKIKAELKSLMDFLNTNKHKIPQKAAIKLKWESADKTAAKIREEIRLWKGMITTIVPTLKLHRYEFNKRKAQYGIALQGSFRSLVTSRNFGGRLVLDNKEKTLTYWVSPDEMSEHRAKLNFTETEDGNVQCDARRTKDFTQNLSGGERSFATICFFVALWRTMEAPFYILDEFDVFMDAQNRDKSQQILNCHTESQPEAQFFFFTPLDLEGGPSSRNVTILKLQAPERLLKLHAGESSPEGDENDASKADKRKSDDPLQQPTKKRSRWK